MRMHQERFVDDESRVDRRETGEDTGNSDDDEGERQYDRDDGEQREDEDDVHKDCIESE